MPTTIMMKPSSIIERVAGSLPTEVTLTVIAAAAGAPLAALLPILAKSLAGERQKQRIESSLVEINELLQRHENSLANITDQQYKFINEAVLALLHTTNQEKMDFLTNVVRNSLTHSDFPDQEAVFLSRIIRDISADEARFVLKNFSYERIWLNELDPGESDQKTLVVQPNTPDGRIVLGLVALGLVMAAEPTWDDTGLLRYTPMVAKLLALLKRADT